LTCRSGHHFTSRHDPIRMRHHESHVPVLLEGRSQRYQVRLTGIAQSPVTRHDRTLGRHQYFRGAHGITMRQRAGKLRIALRTARSLTFGLTSAANTGSVSGQLSKDLSFPFLPTMQSCQEYKNFGAGIIFFF